MKKSINVNYQAHDFLTIDLIAINEVPFNISTIGPILTENKEKFFKKTNFYITFFCGSYQVPCAS